MRSYNEIASYLESQGFTAKSKELFIKTYTYYKYGTRDGCTLKLFIDENTGEYSGEEFEVENPYLDADDVNGVIECLTDAHSDYEDAVDKIDDLIAEFPPEEEE